jgi:hypothetical protein
MNPTLSVRTAFVSTLLCVLAFGASAQAASLTVSGWTLGEYVNVTSPTRSGTVATAELNVSGNGVTGFSYCVDLAQSITTGTTTGWEFASPEMSAQVIRAAWLVDTFRPQFPSLIGPSVTKQTEIAALQVAVWEVMGETPGNYNLGSGSFSVSASASVLSLSNTMLGALGNADLSNFDTSAIWAMNRNYQDQLIFPKVNPIPEPATIGLYAFGALIAAFGLKRKVS